MRIRIEFSSKTGYVKLPISYNELVQGMLYKNLPKTFAKFLHDIGFFYNKRSFKLFTFSKIKAAYFRAYKDSKTIIFDSPIVIYISSSIPEITQSLGEYIINKEYVKLGQNLLSIESIEVLKSPIIYESSVNIQTLSPITVYKTAVNDGKKFYRFYNPTEDEFKNLIKENIRKKFEIIKAKSLESFEFDIKPLRYKKVLDKYKNFTIEGYEGEFILNIDPYILNVVYDSGLGAKNSQGFGMIEIM